MSHYPREEYPNRGDYGADLRCTRCKSRARILVFRRAGASGGRVPEPETRLCAVCAGERLER